MSGQPTLLLVEDDALLRAAMALYLAGAGYKVLQAGDTEAARLHLDGGVHLVITDVQLPGSMDGLELAGWIRRHRPDVPVLIVSGIPELADRVAAIGGDVPFLCKPYNHRHLARQVSRLLQRDPSTVT